MQKHNILSPPSNPLLSSFFSHIPDIESTTILNYNLKPRIGNILSQPMPVYPLQSLFPPSDKFPSYSLSMSPRTSINTSPLYSPIKSITHETIGFPITPSVALELFKNKLTK